MSIGSMTFPFRPRARLLQILGDQLIGSPRLAVFELVKNAYDADADTVTVTLENIDNLDRSIIVQDDGVGMSLETIRDIWLVPAHDHRETQRKQLLRTKKKRLPLGEKGVGRFAVHKLGDSIELVTRAAGQEEVVVTIDWDEQIQKEFLSDTQILVNTRTPQIFCGEATGTKLTIRRLREGGWSRGEVRRLLRQITSISSPFKKESDTFRTVLNVPDHPDWVEGLPDVDAILARAPWHFKFVFFQGVLNWSYEFRGVVGIKVEPRTVSLSGQKLLLPPERDRDDWQNDATGKRRRKLVVAPDDMTDGIGPIKGEFYIFDRDRVVLKQLGDSQFLTGFLDENGGVRIYRDNIRVYNYGEPDDDWLNLDLARVNTPTRNISRNITVGAIDLVLEHSAKLVEKTNREGFVEDESFKRLKRIVLGCLSLLQIERKIDKDKIRQVTSKGTDPEMRNIAEPLEALRAAAIQYKLEDQFIPLIDRAEESYNEMRDTLLRAGVSGMGLAVIFHEVERGVRVLFESIKGGAVGDLILNQARELVRVLDGFTELLRKGDRKENSLNLLLRRARDLNAVRFRHHNVRLVCPSLEDNVPDITATFAFGLLLGAMGNLLDNSFYWLRVRWPESEPPPPRKIYMAYRSDLLGSPAIIVADNGPGFADEPDTVIRPFFSRRPEGMGLGLYYANLVMELNGGRLAFPDREEAEVPSEFDGAVVALLFGKDGKF
jgi:signal transduction histidine kinase/anti-sigma regulatory factor (Ser/Thr protein kinase)